MPEDDKIIDSYQEFEALQQEKERTIESYRVKTDALKQESVALENKIKELNHQFNTEYAIRIKKLENTEAEIRTKKTEAENELRAVGKERIELEETKNQAFKGIEVAHQSINEDRAKNEAILSTAEEIRKDANKQIEEVKELRAALEPIKQELFEREKKVTVRERLIPSLEAGIKARNEEATAKLSKANALIKKSEEIKSEATTEMFNIVSKSNELRELIGKTDKKLEELYKEEALIRSKIEESDYKLAQIIAERDKNTRDTVANKAKEILLNEKEKSLKEREKNVKVIEDNITKKGE